MDGVVEYANAVLAEFDTYIPIRVDRTADGSVEIVGLGFLCVGTDDALSDALAELERREVVTVIDQWSRCLSERGYPEFGRLDEPEKYAQQQLDDFEASVYAALPEITDEERAAWIRGEWGDEAPTLAQPVFRTYRTRRLN